MNDIEKPDRTAAYRRAATIRAGVQGFAEAKIAIAEAYEAHDWITLGYTSWGEYCKKEIGNRLKMPRDDRDLAIQAFSELGMSVREIADSLDVAKSTVQDALKPPPPKASGSGQLDQLPADPLSNLPAIELANEDALNAQTSPGSAVPEDGEGDAADDSGSAASSDPRDASGLVGISPADESGEDHTDEERDRPDTGASSPLPAASGVAAGSEPTAPEEPSPEDSGVVDGPERADGVPPAPAAKPEESDEKRVPREVPEWLVAITAVIAAVHDFAALNTTGIADLLDEDLFGDFGLAVSKLDISYAAMSKQRKRDAT